MKGISTRVWELFSRKQGKLGKESHIRGGGWRIFFQLCLRRSNTAETPSEEKKSDLVFFIDNQCSKDLTDRLLFDKVISGASISLVADEEVLGATSPPDTTRDDLNYALAFYPEPKKLLDHYWAELDSIAELDEDACCSKDQLTDHPTQNKEESRILKRDDKKSK